MNKVWKLVSIVVTIVAVVSTAVVGTYAFYTSSDEITNKMRVANPTAKIIEEFDGKEKSVVITNTGNAPVLVRANAEMVCTNDGIALDPSKVADQDYKNLLEEGTYPADKWVKGNDGWYYYAKILYPNETTSELVHIKISINDELTAEEKVVYKNADFEVPVRMEYHYPHFINGKYPHEDNWHIEDENIQEMLRKLVNPKYDSVVE